MDPDLELVRACQHPDSDEFEAAFELLYRKYRDRAYSIAYRITGTTADAMDVVQETFSLVFRKLTTFRSDSLFSTWLFRIVVNCSIDSKRQTQSRRWSRASSLSGLAPASEPADEQLPGPVQCAEAEELGSHVHRSIQQLSPKLRAILVLRYLEGLSYEELCQALSISMGTVKSRLARAHIALHRVLDGTLEPFGFQGAKTATRNADPARLQDPSSDSDSDSGQGDSGQKDPSEGVA